MLELRGLRNAPLNLATLIDEELRATGFPPKFGRAALLAGGLLVLLDGLDEVPADRLDDTIQAIRDLAERHPRCRYITSCRTAFYKDYFPRFTDSLLTDFTDDQIQNLIQNWFRSHRTRHRHQTVGPSESPAHQATRELARTPLLATFLCLVYDDRQTLPTNRAELYGDALRILLERWAASKRISWDAVFPGLSIRRELLMLEGIAGTAYERNQYFFTAKELATAIEGFLRSDANRPDDIDGRKVVEEIEQAGSARAAGPRQVLILTFDTARIPGRLSLLQCGSFPRDCSKDLGRGALARGPPAAGRLAGAGRR